ncbi:transcriptional pleiotropic regulator of transition state genes [Paenibacillus sp. OK060]|uniref:AbrB/MazE/SpoVT family DNA-binding domain-containing protein n=1 Tax=Paenibacillus sp. OK060 TaxID=1881034 RepID=UPI00087F746C|nr:AbrB/MazE/SpoVT family DNA-binding domain-containing protein [Paenibacillus sp. OK060]SDM41755.1 transcriptional pleiotropic regulator of transition state genes [Paenibacillus sp. OK060]
MKSTGIVRKLDQLGRIVLPKELRTTMEIEIKDPIEFLIAEDKGLMVLRKYQGRTCLFCQSPDDLVYFKEKLICVSCISSLESADVQVQAAASKEELILTPTSKTDVKRRKKDSMERLLIVLKDNPEATQNELSTLLDLSQGRISQLIKLIKEQNLL